RQYTFDTFVVGPSNRFAHAASVAVAKSPHNAYNPLFITSGPGLGKTHLLNAIGNAILGESAGAKVVYITAEGFSNEFKEAAGGDRLQGFREKYRSLDVALIDDAHFLSGKGDVQEELFHTFNDLYNANKQIVLTSDRPPKEIPDLEDRLVSRFESGLIADIQPPEYETRAAILRRKARESGTHVDDDILEFIARRVESNIRELGGALNRVVAFSQLMGQPVSVDLAREVLRDLGEVESARTGARVEEAGKSIQPGHCYLVEEDRPEHAFTLLSSTIRGGGRGVLITRSNPRRVREKHEVDEARMIWLTERESGTVETIPPSLERIIYVIEEFMKEGGRGAVMIDGIEYLVSSNSFDAVLKFLRRLVDHTSESPFVLLVSVSTKTMKEQEVKNLEREMEVLAF
ncbi:MAG TPA: DnaA/Hda family protein, partial [Thermoplasmata archaeon]|nr:DnaA/Hda family protein [Thermoplasmata archaeon]